MNKALLRSRSNRFILMAIVLLILFAVGFAWYSSLNAKPAPPSAPEISQRMLEDQYGLGVNLVAVTARGGMVDLRLKILDAEKAKRLLENTSNFPTLYASDVNVTLNVDADVKSQKIDFEAGNLFLLYPNSGNAVKPGTAVTILFGNTIKLEPMVAR